MARNFGAGIGAGTACAWSGSNTSSRRRQRQYVEFARRCFAQKASTVSPYPRCLCRSFVHSAVLCRVRDPPFRMVVIDRDVTFALLFVRMSGLLVERRMTLPNLAR